MQMACLIGIWLGLHIGLVGSYAELVEINHLMTAEGKPVFVQVIPWDWDAEYGRWDAQGYVLVSDWERVGKVVHFRDSAEKRGSVRFSVIKETWTTYDPERLNLKLFPQCQRRKVW